MNYYNIISFPGLGIDGLRIRNAAFSLFGKEVAWYGVILTLGIIFGYLYAAYRRKDEGITDEQLLDITVVAVILAILGARTYYVLTTLERYHSFYDVIAIWEGGIAVYGAIIGGAIAIWLMSRRYKIRLMKAYDMASPCMMLGQIIGRWGNFVNGEAHGGKTTSFLRMTVLRERGGRAWTEAYCVHPTFLYESVWNLAGWLLIHFLYKKKQYNGQVFFFYIAWYGFGRFWIEGLRTDSLYIGSFRISQLVGAACFFVGAGAMIAAEILRRKGKLPKFMYRAPEEYQARAEESAAKAAERAAKKAAKNAPPAR